MSVAIKISLSDSIPTASYIYIYIEERVFTTLRNTQVFITRFMLHFSTKKEKEKESLWCIDLEKVDDDFQVWSPNAFVFDSPATLFFFLPLEK